MSLYSHAGVSRQNGSMKVRFANDALRVKVLAKNGHKDIDIVELREPLTKEAAVAFLLSIDFANGNKDVQAALEAAADKRGVTVVKAVAKAPKVVVSKSEAKRVEALTGEKVMSVKEANAAILKQLADKEAVAE
jgi:fructose-specific component phosphotransferase system IIB-like protein